ncbi:MAG TPA: hypothetical protein VMA36_07470 [Candidatus Limnocylindria bacterium]|jgi:hypothetical protein|nr:hypothetical protein [Candidatus Limnocylindria bacterium]
MTEAAIFKGVALIGALIVGITASVQLKNDWQARGLDATVTKLLLGLMAFGCVLALLAAVNVLGVRGIRS